MKALVNRLQRTLRPTLSRLEGSYGKYLPIVYGVYVVLFTSMSFGSFIGISAFSGLGTGPIFIAGLLVLLFHFAMTNRLVDREMNPSQLLYHQRLKTLVYLISLSSLFLLLFLSMLLEKFSLDVNFGVVTLRGALVYFLVFSLSLMVNSAFYNFISFSYHKEARLCFKSILEVYKRIMKDENKRIQIAYSHLLWFRKALHSCNSFLVKKPYCREVKDIDEYIDALFNVAQIGNTTEIRKMSKIVESILDSLGKGRKSVRLRDLLVALRSAREKPYERKGAWESLETLGDMWKTSTRLDRAKSTVKSPLTVSIVAIITAVLAVISIIVQLVR